MSNKLLKVCAAVMLIAGMGNALCNTGTEAKAAAADTKPATASTTKPANVFSVGQSAETDVIAKVKALIEVEFDGLSKTLSLIKDDGTEEDDEGKTSFTFKVNKIATGYGLELELTNGFIVQDQGVYLTYLKDETQYKLPVNVDLFCGDTGVPCQWGDDSKCTIPFSDNKHVDTWKVQATASLAEDTNVGDYKGKIKITVVSVG